MPLAVVNSRALMGVRATSVNVEVHLSGGLPKVNIVGLPEAEVRESRDRVRAAILHNRFTFPQSRMTVNLAPANFPKEGGRYDLPIAIGILVASNQLPKIDTSPYEFAAELALDGRMRSCGGSLPMVLAAAADNKTFIMAPEDAKMAALANVKVLIAHSLLEVCAHLLGQKQLEPATPDTSTKKIQYDCLSEVKGQPLVKRALKIAAAGGHSIVMLGSPGSGKSMLASRFVGLMPPLTNQEALEKAAVHSLINKQIDATQFRTRSFRAPHHSASAPALVGGGSKAQPGEISLAHHGILFLDELPEFNRNVLEALREPLETGTITVSRAAMRAQYPASFQLIAAMNPCPCGYWGHKKKQCQCTLTQVQRYRNKISGPLLDRIDMHMEVPALTQDELTSKNNDAETSASIRQQTTQARQFQLERQGLLNAHLTVVGIERYCGVDEKAQELIRRATDRLNLSARAYHRILKISRTIADMAQEDDISAQHLAEAIQLRRPLFSSDYLSAT